MRFYHYVVSLLIGLFLMGCEGNSTKPNEKTLLAENSHNNQKVDSGKVKGRIIMMDDSALPENSVITITLADTSFVGLPSLILAQKNYYSLSNRPTIPFELTYLKNEVRPEAVLVVSVALNANGQLLSTAETDVEVVNNNILKEAEVMMSSAN